MEPNICNAQLQMMPTAFHPLNPNPFIHYYHGTLPPLFFRKLYRIWPILHWKCSRPQAGVKWNGTPAQSPQIDKFRRNGRISVTPAWGFYPFSAHLQGFRFAPPPACILTPRQGLCGTECRMFQVNCYIMAYFNMNALAVWEYVGNFAIIY